MRVSPGTPWKKFSGLLATEDIIQVRPSNIFTEHPENLHSQSICWRERVWTIVCTNSNHRKKLFQKLKTVMYQQRFLIFLLLTFVYHNLVAQHIPSPDEKIPFACTFSKNSDPAWGDD